MGIKLNFSLNTFATIKGMRFSKFDRDEIQKMIPNSGHFFLSDDAFNEMIHRVEVRIGQHTTANVVNHLNPYYVNTYLNGLKKAAGANP